MNDQFENAYHRLTGLKNQAENAQSCMNNFRKETGSFITDKALKHFFELNEMDADDIRKFGSVISECTRTLTENLNKLNYKVKKKADGGNWENSSTFPKY